MGEKAGGESASTVVVAGLANLGIALAKAVAGIVGGSAAMLSEAAHSVADTTTEVLLFTALRRGARPADPVHPFGYGKATYFWALLAAFAMFVAGAGFSITQGLHTLRDGEDPGDFRLSYLVLGVSFVLEAISLTKALRQVRRAGRRRRIGMPRYLRLTPDTTVTAVVLEDSAALAGLVIAAAGLLVTELTGSPVADGVASIAIGLLLVVVAVLLVRANASLLVGKGVPEPLVRRIRAELTAVPTVRGVVTLFTMYLGPDALLVAAKVDFRDDASGADLEAAAEDAERRLRAAFPSIRYVFLDPTPGRPDTGEAPLPAPEPR